MPLDAGLSPAVGAATRRIARVAVALLAGLAALLGLLAAPASAQSAEPTETGSSGEATQAADDGAARPLVVIGTTGLTWEDVTAEATPTLWDLGTAGAVGNLVVRSLRSATCPVDGWLALSAGARAADLTPEERTFDFSGLRCRPLRNAVDGVVPGWEDYLTAAADSSYETPLGLFGDELEAAGIDATAIGPGAAIALATSTGEVAGTAYPADPDSATLTTQVSDAVERSQVVVVDAGDLREYIAPAVPEHLADPIVPDPETYRADQVADLDERVAAVLAGISESGTDPVIVVASVADYGRTSELQVLTVAGLGAGDLTSSSTRQVGYLLSTDVLPGFLELAGITNLTTADDDVLVGAAPQVREGEESDGGDRIGALADAEKHAQAQRPLIAPYYLVLVVLNVALFSGVALGLRRPAPERRTGWFVRLLTGPVEDPVASRPRVLRGVRGVSVALAAVPVSTFLANLVPWWRPTAPAVWLFLATVVIAAAITALALAPPWRTYPLAPMGIVSAITVVVLAVDIALGARLQIGAVMGVSALVGARFYGFNNTAFALVTTASILFAVAIANPLVRTGRRRLAAILVAVIGVVVAVLDGAPSIGADFGGPPAIVPAFGILTLMAAGIRITWRRVVLVLGGAALASAALAFADYLRPASERSHLGRFVATVLDGGAWDVIARKAEANLRILANNRPLTILAITGVALVVFVLARPVSKVINSPGGGRFAWLSSGAPISQMADVTPMLRPGLVALAVALGIGFAINDSGIAIPAYGVAVAVPLLLAACASWMLSLPGSRDGQEAENSDDGAAHARRGSPGG